MFQFVSALRFGAAVLAIYYASVSGSYTLGMSVFSITSLVQLGAEIPTGVLSDRFGRKPMVVLGAVLSVAFAVFYALGTSYWFLAAGAAIEGLARAVFSGNGEAMLHDTLAEEGLESRYADSLGKVKAGEDVGLAISAVLGGVIAAVWSLQAAFWITVIPVVLALGISLLLREPVRRQRPVRHDAVFWPAVRTFMANPRLRLLLIGSTLREALGESAFQFRTLFFQTLWPLWALGIAQTLTYVASAASFYLSGRILDRVRGPIVLIADAVLGRVLNLVALLLPSILSPALMSGTSITYGASIVATNSLQQREFTEVYRATMGSISSQVENVGMAVGALLLGLLADWVGVANALLGAQLLLIALVVPYLLVLRQAQSRE